MKPVSNFSMGSWLRGKKSIINLALGLTIMFSFSLISISEVNSIQKTKLISDKTQKCQLELEQILFLVNTAETIEYKFSVTGDENYINYFLNTLKEIESKIRNIKNLHQDNSCETEWINVLLFNVNNRFKNFNKVIELINNRKYNRSDNLLQIENDIETSGKISSIIHNEILNESRRSELLTNIIVAGSKKTTLLICLIAFSGIFSLGFFTLSLHSEIKERKRTEKILLFNEKRLEMLFKISQFKSESVHELLDFALNEAVMLTKSQIGYICSYDEKKQVLVLNSWSNEVMKESTNQNPEIIYPLEKAGIWGEAVRQRRPVIINDFQASHPLERGLPASDAQLFKFLTVPILVDDRIDAVIGVANKETNYDQTDIIQLTLLMDSVWKIVEEYKLHLELRKWAKIFENSQWGIVVINSDCRTIEKLNPAFAKMNGLSVEDMVNREFTSFMSPPSGDEFIKHLSCAVKEGHHTAEFNCTMKNNSVIPVYIDMTAVKDTNNRLLYIIVHVQDITKRVQALEALKASEEKYRLIFENIPAGIFTRDLQGKYLSFNPFLINLFECKSAEEFDEKYSTLSKRWSAPEKNAEFVDIILKNKVISGYEVEAKIANGKYKWFSTSAYWDEVNQIINGFSIDITEQKFAEIKLKEKNDELDRFFSLSLDLLCIATIDGFFIKLNKAWETVLGYSIKDLEGTMFLDLVHPDDIDATVSSISQLSENNPVLNFVNRYRRKDGSYRWIEWRSYPYENKLIYAAARDITDRIKTEQELKELNSTKDKFFSIIAHDLKSPFSALLGISEMLSDDNALNEDERKEFIHSLKELSQNAYKLLENLLNWSRIQTGRMQFSPSNLNMFFTVQNVLELLKEIANQKRIKIINQVNIDSFVSADENMLQLIIRNLISNAVKFSFQDSSIKITSLDLGDFIQISVKDSGVGMSKKKIEGLFLLDKQNSTLGTAKEVGTGLGLVLCKDMIIKQGGKIWAESEVGSGSTFHFTLPKVKM